MFAKSLNNIDRVTLVRVRETRAAGSSPVARPSELGGGPYVAQLDPYRLFDQQEGPAGANALAVGGVDGHRSKWSACKWPWWRTAARPITGAADDAVKRRTTPQDTVRPRYRRIWWSGVCRSRDALGTSPLLEQNFAGACAKNRRPQNEDASADSAIYHHYSIDRHRD